MFSHLRSRRGDSLVELLVALVILEVVGATALAAGFTVERLNRRASQGAADDVGRWQEYRAAETAASCANAVTFDTLTLAFPQTVTRQRLETLLRCGR